MQRGTQSQAGFQKTAESFVAGAKTLPRKYFVAAEVFSQEQEKIFADQWILAGHQSQIANSGDYLIASVAGESLIIVRGQDSRIRGFYNVCRHRGTRLCQDLTGHVRAIQCPYHAWTYALDGSLAGAPHMDEVAGFDKAQYALHPVNLGMWEGFIFINLGGEASLRLRTEATARETQRRDYSIEEWFASLAGKFAQWNLPNLKSAKRIQYDVKANWKLIFENYSECYHCPGVHPALSKVSPYDSAENDLIEGPFLGGFMRINRGKSLTMSGNACAIPVDSNRDHEHEHEHEYEYTNEIEHRVFYYSIFPNMLLSMHPDYVMVHQIWPQTPDRTLIYCDWFFHPDAMNQPGFNPNDAVQFWDMTNQQDWHVCELSQQGIASRAYQPGPYSARESIPAAFDRYYRRVMNDAK
ncbi:MAG TPA: aromatic ring-hydroxylating dioxygenase subunit alpha [Chthoniobacterales bacterium]|nr:aromatic ring-hydroxylating dioxygenase subunit alpha [Chthoniobacterales bacterium]